MTAVHERVRAALELREPDRVPTFDLMMGPSTVGRILGKKPSFNSVLLSNPYASKVIDGLFRLSGGLGTVLAQKADDLESRLFARDAAEAAVKMGYDAAWISYYPVFRLRDSKTMDDCMGRLYDLVIDKHGYLGIPMYRGGLIRTEDDWRCWDKGPLLRLPAKANTVFSGIMREYGERLFIFGLVIPGLFESTCQPMGFERFVLAARKSPRFVGRMVRFYTDLHCMLIEAMADGGLPAVVFSDDLAYRSGPMLSPRMLENLYGDGYRRITSTAHALGMKIVIHSCGNVTPLLNWLADCGFDGIQSLEPTAGVELAEAKKIAGDRLCLIGNMDVARVLVDAGREELEQAVRKAIADAGAGGGFILSPAHNHEDVSIERLRWMLEAAGRHGRYPLQRVE